MDDSQGSSPAPGTSGPGWRVRERAPSRQSEWDELSSPPPPPPIPTLPLASAAPLRSPRHSVIVVVAALALFGVAGGAAVLLTGARSTHIAPVTTSSANTPTSRQNTQATLNASVEGMQNAAFRASINVYESLSIADASGVYGGQESETITIDVDHESARRSELRERINAGGATRTVIAVQYDGTAYLSTDNGATYKTFPSDQAQSHFLDPTVPVVFLGMVDTVTSAGSVEIDGVSATQYHAQLDPVKLTAFLRTLLASQNDPLSAKVVNSTGGTDGMLDAYVDGDGHVLSDEGSWDTAVDLGALDAQESGTTLNEHIAFGGSFSDYGGQVTVTRPVQVTGSTSLI